MVEKANAYVNLITTRSVIDVINMDLQYIFQASLPCVGEPANVLGDNIVADVSRKRTTPAVVLPGQSLMEARELQPQRVLLIFFLLKDNF